ncbi:hypothetical protein AXE65_02705 [Ventosimonas gracilis]|uniref:SPOR domain-containing protein n=1 Tax=Ventosimonas gracilis TaxID=1680762 RepID=A0A139STC4_9GAMM|nr:hypothetical protein AXE65_02705 [Ventosimonas gracilis]
MAWLNQKLRQRLLGAFVLTALAVIFLPMLLTQEQEPAQVQIEIPDMPNMPAMPEIRVETTTVPEAQIMDDDTDITLDQLMSADDESDAAQELVANEGNSPLVAETSESQAEPAIEKTTDPLSDKSNAPLVAKVPDTPVAPTGKTTESPAKPVVKETPVASNQSPTRRLDSANLPISWSIQLASLKNHGNAEKLRDDLRRKGYNAYIRSADGMSKVLVGPLIDLNAANHLRSELEIKQQLKGFVTRFTP